MAANCSKTKYLDFYKYVQQLQTCLQRWSKDAQELLGRESAPLFADFIPPSTDEFIALFKLADSRTSLVKVTLEEICKELLVVTERQLGDFLEGGRYYNITDPDMRAKMEHSQLTNLIGEACFGDLDFSIFKRRIAAIHHRSTINMVKRNKTMSVWFQAKSEAEQGHLLEGAAKKRSYPAGTAQKTSTGCS